MRLEHSIPPQSISLTKQHIARGGAIGTCHLSEPVFPALQLVAASSGDPPDACIEDFFHDQDTSLPSGFALGPHLPGVTIMVSQSLPEYTCCRIRASPSTTKLHHFNDISHPLSYAQEICDMHDHPSMDRARLPALADVSRTFIFVATVLGCTAGHTDLRTMPFPLGATTA